MMMGTGLLTLFGETKTKRKDLGDVICSLKEGATFNVISSTVALPFKAASFKTLRLKILTVPRSGTGP